MSRPPEPWGKIPLQDNDDMALAHMPIANPRARMTEEFCTDWAQKIAIDLISIIKSNKKPRINGVFEGSKIKS